MKPIKKTIMVTLEYWECNNHEHRHKTEEIAQLCIEKNKIKKELPAKEELMQRNIDIAMKWANGARISDIAKSVGLSDTRVSQITWKILRISRSRKLGLPLEPEEPFISRGGIKPEYRDHYLMRVKAVADFWGKWA